MSKSANWFHCSVKPISRSAGRSVVAAAAYRSGECLHDELTDQTHDYTRRSGVENTFIVAPDHAPIWANDWGKLWNAAERSEKRRNSQTGREVELALPASVSGKERESIARKIAVHLVERYGVAVAVALHEPSRHGDGRNYHAHILMTTRRMGKEGFCEKTRELDDKKTGGQEVRHIREYAATVINDSLAGSGSNERVDPRSHKDRGIEQLPSKHLGVEASAMERRKKKSRLGDLNREIEASNQLITQLQGERATLDAEITKEQTPKTTRERHYAQVREQQAAFKRPKVAKAVYRICESVGFEKLRKLAFPPPDIEPSNPIDPTPSGSYRRKLQQERETQGNDISR